MANLNVKDGASASKYLKASGTGTDGDPYIPQHLVTGPLTDTELRASDVKITLDSEMVTVSGLAGNYLGQQVLTFVSAANQNATLPIGTKGIWITSENNPAYLAVNTTAAPTTAGIYAPKDVTKFIGPYNGITSLGVYAASGVYVHLIYES